MADKSLKVGVIGAGRMGVTHHCIINSHPDVAVVAIADPSPLVTMMMSKYAGVRAYKDYRSLLDKEQLDAVLVCTPPAANHDVLSAVADLNIHAFVEKPFTLSAASGAELATRFQERGLVNQVGYTSRFNDALHSAKLLLDQGVIGRVIRFRSETFSSAIIRDPGEDGWRSTHANGGGATYEMGSHAIDMVNYLVGAPDRVSGTSLTKVWSRNVEDIASASFIYDSGLSGSIYVNWSDPTYRKPTTRFEVFGSKGKLIADYHGIKLYLNEPNEAHGFAAGWNQRYITDLFTPAPFYLRGFEFTSQMYHFVDHVLKGDLATRCTFADGVATLKVIERMFSDNEADHRVRA
ncbi:Gfo/Idh/MocA family oxidoreductase [Brevundimonas sp.]|uniref:Gfo/Idh/MocA family protein n=1 Tax=Brevundimonas sp. TaxID=1871086 RepID=UPI0025BFE47B|nr:Gfo/Idh/MocA family oxidoreductase [Brevundimonas sp.]